MYFSFQYSLFFPSRDSHWWLSTAEVVLALHSLLLVFAASSKVPSTVCIAVPSTVCSYMEGADGVHGEVRHGMLDSVHDGVVTIWGNADGETELTTLVIESSS
jgi:hypothetical protein